VTSTSNPFSIYGEGAGGGEFDGLLCDLDGTLLDSEPWHKAAEIQAFATFGIHFEFADLHRFTGGTLRAMLATVSEESGKEITRDAFLDVQMPLLTEMICTQMRPFEDAIRFLERFRTTEKAMAVVTSSSQWYVDLARSQFGFLNEFFPVWICGTDVQNGKPHPEPYLRGKELLGIQNALVIEDSHNGVASGKAAGCTVIAADRHAEGGFESADLVVRNLDSLLPRLTSG
jgi:beta-phosphoglucomutase